MPIEVLMPALSPTMTEGNLAKWLKNEGDRLSPGDIIAEIETDKATMEVESVDFGILAKILVKEGSENVKVNQLIALVIEDGEDLSVIKNYLSKNHDEKINQKIEKKEEIERVETNIENSGRIIASPLAKRIASNESVDISKIDGTGPRGRIIKSDVIDHIDNNRKHISYDDQKICNITEANYIEIPNNNMRKIIAKRLLESKQNIPHFYLSIECELDSLLLLRTELNNSSNEYKLSVNDFIIKASAKALKLVPEANSSWSNDSIIQYNNIDISVAVAIDGGLITPIIKDADIKTLSIISNQMKDLANRAKIGKLSPEEFQGGNFSISNLGMYGVKNFSAIINPPQSCILAVGAGTKRPIIKNDEISIATIMDVTLSVDHRSVDGAVGARFLKEFKNFIENPILMLI